MKYLYFFALCSTLISCGSQKIADNDTQEWRYEIEAVGTGISGTYQIKVWSYSKKPETAIEQSKKNAIHGVIFKGFPDKDRIKGQRPLFNRELTTEYETFFSEFFKNGGDYQRFVTLASNGQLDVGDRIKIGKEYKIGVIVTINVNLLRQHLEDKNIIRSLSDGF